MPEQTIDKGFQGSATAINEMIEAGVFYGRKKSKTHPKMKDFVFANRGGIDVIDLNKTLEKLNEALEFLKEKAKNGASIMFVGIHPAAAGIEQTAKELGYPFVINRWLGGTLTNYKILSSRLNYFKKLEKDFKENAFENYPKKERFKIQKEIERLSRNFYGLENFDRLPDVLVVINPIIHEAAILEAKKINIPVVVFSNIDANPAKIDYLIPGNDLSTASADWFLGQIKKAISEAKKL
ncbi:MAG: 30S ribosomal protein S2 [Patescibacteria group bacterium]|nr:30S ribosomal protein S2 [Patescibacteria group bacterium]